MTAPALPGSVPSSSRDMALGIACGVGAGALWGLIFIAPELTREFSPLQQSIGRYLAYGVLSLLLIGPRWRAVTRGLGARAWLGLAWLALCGNVLYYVMLSSAVKAGGVTLTSLILGFVPVAVTLVGSRDRGAVPLPRLVPSLLLCAAGAVCIGWQAVAAPQNGDLGGDPAVRLLGAGFALGALALWTLYAIGNARWLGRMNGVSAHDWSLLVGVMTGAQSLALIPLALLLDRWDQGAEPWLRFAAVSAGVAVLCSIFGNALWNRMSRLLPLTLVGQMILFETVFALIYGFAWEQRLPTAMEAAAFVLVVASVLSCIAAHRPPKGAR